MGPARFLYTIINASSDAPQLPLDLSSTAYNDVYCVSLGVYAYKFEGKKGCQAKLVFQAKLKHRGTLHYIGRLGTSEEAARAHDR